MSNFSDTKVFGSTFFRKRLKDLFTFQKYKKAENLKIQRFWIFHRCPKGQHISVAFMHNRKTAWLFFIAYTPAYTLASSKNFMLISYYIKKGEDTELKIPIHTS